MIKPNSRFILQFAALISTFISFMNVQAKPYRGGELRTNAALQYGRFEVRMQSGAGSGMLSSFFTFQDTQSLPDNWNEIDIEIMGRYTNEIQYNVITQWTVGHEQRVLLPFNPHAAFHVYAIEWTPDYIAWQVDGYEIYRQSGGHTATVNLAQKLMMNIWQPTSVEWAGAFNPANLPIYAYYDWVKYYAYTPGVNDNFTFQWSDDFATWYTPRWAKASHTFDGNNVDFTPANVVFFNGYMILCLTTSTVTGYSGGTVQDTDTDAPYLVKAEAYPNHALVCFSEQLDPAEAGQISHYTIPGATVLSADLRADQKSVVVNLSGFDPAIAGNLIISGLKDLAGNIMGVIFKPLKKPLAMPLSVNVAGGAAGAALADSVWDAGKDFGTVGGNVHDNGSLVIQGTNEAELYRWERRDITGYHVRLPKGIYTVILKFAETEYASSGSRVFNVNAEGVRYLDNLDIFNEVGANQALEKTLPNIAVDDYRLDLYFEDVAGAAVLSGIEVHEVALSVEEHPVLPEVAELRVFPNPFNPETTIEFNLSRPGAVTLDLVGITGKSWRIYEQSGLPAGVHRVSLFAERLSSGIYFINMSQNGQRLASRKIMLLK